MGKANISKGVGLKALNAFVWSLAGVLSTLTLITAAVVAIQLGDFLPEDVDVFFLVPKDPSIEVSSGDNVWTTNTTIDIFSSSYKNEKGDVVVSSRSGDLILAPGVRTDYKFKLHNNGNMAIDYNVLLDFGFLHNGGDYALDKLPLVARVYSAEDENYIVGTNDGWIPVSEMMNYEDSGTLGVNSYNEYTLELWWPFYEGEPTDERDTMLGTMAANGDNIEFQLDITTHAEQNIDPAATGGIVDEDAPTKLTGGKLDPLPVAALVTLTVLSGAALITAATTSVIIKMLAKSKKIIPPAPAVPQKKEAPPAPPAPEPPKRKRVRKKRIIKQNPGRWHNHKKLTERKKRRSKKRRLGL